MEFDLLVVGGGINGAGVARDAAGRGVRTAVIDMGDFGGATSSASTKLIHGGLRYLEYYEFRLVAESLAERAVVLKLAPQLVAPLRFIMPHVPQLRPQWMIRIGLWMYDHIGGRHTLPDSEGVSLNSEGLGAGLKPELKRGFSYYDAWVDDARLVMLNIKSAAAHGATILPRQRLVSAVREDGGWRVTLEHALSGARSELRCRVLVNAGGPWVKQVVDASGGHIAAKVRLVKGSHIVVPRLHSGDHAYILQNTDKRVIFVIPFQQHWSLIGTTDLQVASAEAARDITPEETAYLIAAVNHYLAKPISEHDVVWSFSGVRPLYDDGQGDPAAVTRDYTLVLDDSDGSIALAIFGGKLTTYRKLGEAVLKKLAPWLAYRRGPWTDTESLPGGGFEPAERTKKFQELCAGFPQLPADLLADLFLRHGLDAAALLADAKSVADLGRHFGGSLYQREVEHFIRHEWAMTAEDVLWRRTKSGLRMTADERTAFSDWFTSAFAAEATV